MSQRRPVEVFSLSFLDVIACAVGAILFITILSVFQSVVAIDPELAQELSAAESDSRVVERMQAQMEEAAKLDEQLKQVQQQVDETSAGIAAERQRLQVAQETEKLRQMLAQMESSNAQAASVARVVQRSNPQARDSAKENDMFIAFPGGGKVRVVSRSGRSFSSPHYDIDDSLLSSELTAEGDGYEIDAGLLPGGDLAKFIARFDPKVVYAECYVTPQSFEDFFKVREYLISQGFEVGIIFLPDVDKLYYGQGGSRSRVQ